MIRPVLHAERLELRPMGTEHLPLHHQLDADPKVMHHLLGRSRTFEEIDEFWIPRCADTIAGAVGLGWWVGFIGDQCVGWWALGCGDSSAQDDLGSGETEIGWRVLRSHWGQGLAPEGARILLQYAFKTVWLQRVWAETMTVNTQSRRVMEKIGMRHVDTAVREWNDPLPGSELGEVIYEITRQDWH